MSGAQEGPECGEGQNCVSSCVEPWVFLKVSTHENNTDAKICLCVYRSGPSVLCCQHKKDFEEVDRKKAWQTVGPLVANNFTS